ncbi:hypothetical protein U9M48_025173 [Paspalum notatum var. saurae]|uniref:ATP-dependent RNA helicase n=1 Tax=Paspalum notatum var. saurae TaxID=547442 RepID=A0AAQ3TS20_PASNO
MHPDSERTEENISSQFVKSDNSEKKVVAEQEQSRSITLPDTKRCFACNQTSHSLDQCKIKYKLVTVAHQFGYATKFPFSMIQPSEGMVEKENFYRNCVLITSNVSNLDLGMVKGELQKFWKLSGDWELRRECRKSFLASLSSEGDVISSLKHPKMETLLDDKEVTLSVTRWMEGGDEKSLDLIEEWFLVCGVPITYRKWNVLYQVASAFGVLVEVDEESLEVEDKEPIRLKIALRSLDDALFSYRFVFGRSSRMIMLTVEGVKCIEEFRLNGETKDNQISTPAATIHNSNKTTALEEKCIEESRSNGETKDNQISAPAATITSFSKTITVEPKCIEESRLNGETDNNQISAPAATKTNSNKTITVEAKCIEESRLNGETGNNQISAPAATTTNSNKTITVEVKCMEESRLNGETDNNQISAPAATTTNSNNKTIAVEAKCIEESRLNGETDNNQISDPAATTTSSNKTTVEAKCMEQSRLNGETNNNQISVSAATIDSSNETTETSKSEEVQSIGQSPTSMIGEEHYKGIPKPPIKYVFKRRGKKQQVTEETKKSPTNKLDEGIGPESSSSAKRIGASTEHGVEMDQKGSEVIFHEKQLLQNSKDIGIYDTFSEMGLQENLLKGIHQYGLEKPSPVHQRGIVPLCKGLSVIHQSLSGTTVTLCSGVLQRLDCGSAECQALILVPTPNLEQRTKKVIQALGQFLGVKAQTCTEGTIVHADQQTLSSKDQVVVSTPGCILDMLQRHALCPDHIRMIVLDEADELLTGGPKDQICNIIQHLPTKIQVGLFSATFSNEALETGRRFMDKPVTVIVPRDEELKHIMQFYLKVEKEELKLGKLYALFKATDVKKIIIFVNTKDTVTSLTKDVESDYTVSECHDGMDQHARDTAIQKFLSGSSNILITNGIRGTNALHLPIPIPIVINYDLPTQPMQYIRRILQQNGQSGKKGVVISMVTPSDEGTLSDIRRFSNSKMRELPPNI